MNFYKFYDKNDNDINKRNKNIQKKQLEAIIFINSIMSNNTSCREKGRQALGPHAICQCLAGAGCTDNVLMDSSISTPTGVSAISEALL